MEKKEEKKEEIKKEPEEKPEEESEKENFVIKFDKVDKFYAEDAPVLKGINLEIKEGEFISLVGPSGSGKSTFLKLIYAEEKPTEGNVLFGEISIATIKKSKLPAHRRNIGTIFQDFKLLPKRTAFENVAYAMEVSGFSKVEIEEDVPQILEIVGLQNKANKFPHQLSGGEQQKVAIARALVNKPLVIIADEPTGNLDPESSQDIVELLLEINKLGKTIVLASHDKEIVDRANKRVVALDNGKIVCDTKKGKYKVIKCT